MRPYRAASGYTLMEVLVVVIITGIMTGLVIFSLGRDQRGDPQAQLQRLAGLTEHWCQRAVLEGRPLGIRITGSGYDFWLPDSLGGGSGSDPDYWQTVADEPAFVGHEWDEALQTVLLLQGQSAPLDAEQPQIICHASSELTPFVLNLSRPGQRPAVLQGSLAGRLQLRSRDG